MSQMVIGNPFESSSSMSTAAEFVFPEPVMPRSAMLLPTNESVVRCKIPSASIFTMPLPFSLAAGLICHEHKLQLYYNNYKTCSGGLECSLLSAPFRSRVLWRCSLLLVLLECQGCPCTYFSACVQIERCLCGKRMLALLPWLRLRAQLDQDMLCFFVDLAHDR